MCREGDALIYPYRCQCGFHFDVIKPIADIDNPEHCPKCNELGERYISSSVFFCGEKVDHAEYNPALGCITKNSKHRKQLAKDRGLEEIGNESVQNIHKHFESQKERELSKTWDDV